MPTSLLLPPQAGLKPKVIPMLAHLGLTFSGLTMRPSLELSAKHMILSWAWEIFTKGGKSLAHQAQHIDKPAFDFSPIFQLWKLEVLKGAKTEDGWS